MMVISNFWLKMIIFTIYISIHEIMNLPYDILAAEFAITFNGKLYGNHAFAIMFPICIINSIKKRWSDLEDKKYGNTGYGVSSLGVQN